MEIGQIVLGHVNELLGLNKDISLQRLEICLVCPLFISDLGGICNSKLYLNPITEDVSTKYKDGYGRGCGCRLLAKTKVPLAHCPNGKW